MIKSSNQWLMFHCFHVINLTGMGPMPWTVNSEIYPLWARSTGNACSAGVNWIFNVLVSLTFLHVAEFLTYYGKTPSGGQNMAAELRHHSDLFNLNMLVLI